MRSRLLQSAASLCALLLFAPAIASDVSGRDRLKKEVAEGVAAMMGPEIVDDLEASGLAQSDAMRIAAQLGEDAAECLMVASELVIGRSGEDPKEVFETVAKSDLHRYFEDQGEFEQLMTDCLINALANAGLSPD